MSLEELFCATVNPTNTTHWPWYIILSDQEFSNQYEKTAFGMKVYWNMSLEI